MFFNRRKLHFFMFFMIFSQIFMAAQVYKEKAIVSFYGSDFHGKKTSNGELFNMNDFTCANKVLPFNTILKVTNLANSKSVEVRVNDRGPFVDGRELDLSKAAAQKIGMIKSGTATVKIEIVKLGENTKLSQQTAKKACEIMERKTGKKYYVPSYDSLVKSPKKYEEGTFWDFQIASFTDKANAKIAAQKLYDEGFRKIVFQTKDEVTRVVIKEVPAAQVAKMEEKLQEKGYKNYLIKQRKSKS